jgi:hypothetical protein
MKIKKTVIANVMSLLFVGSAIASGNNSVYIDQTAADNSIISIIQTGSGNNVGDRNNLITPAFVIDGNNMNLTINQDGMNNFIIGNFIGGDSAATINQVGSGNTFKLNHGNFGTNGGLLYVDKTGDNNFVEMNMGTTANTGNYNYSLTVVGNTNSVTSTMNSKYITNTISLTGNANTVTTIQNGANGTANSPGHQIQLSVVGNANTFSITQNGTITPNIVTLNVAGNNTSTTIIQH